MTELTLYTPAKDDERFRRAERLLETAYLEYSTELDDELLGPELEIQRDETRKVYKGTKKIEEFLEEAELEDLERRF